MSQSADSGRDRGRPPRVVIVDDHALLAESVVLTLRSTGLEAQSVRYDLPDLAGAVFQTEPDLVLLDLFLGDHTCRSTELIVALRRLGLPVIAVTASSDRLVHAESIEAGALAIIEKSAPIEALIEAVQRALRGETLLSQSRRLELLGELDASRRAKGNQSTASSLEWLTHREREVLEALTEGRSAGWIANQHNTSILTVRSHIRSILTKLGVHSQLEAVSLATRNHWFG